MTRVLVTLLLLAMTLTACGTPMDEAGARKAATDFFMTAPHEGDRAPEDVVITSVKPVNRDTASGWEVAINGRIVLPGLPDGYLSAMILFVDGSTGKVSIVAQG